VVSDRYAGYHFLEVLQQQLCWCHVIRQLVEIFQRPGRAGRRGAELAALAREVIGAHRAHLTDGRDPGRLAAELAPPADPDAARAVRRRPPCPDGELRRRAARRVRALWTFCDVPDLAIGPTNYADVPVMPMSAAGRLLERDVAV